MNTEWTYFILEFSGDYLKIIIKSNQIWYILQFNQFDLTKFKEHDLNKLRNAIDIIVIYYLEIDFKAISSYQ